MQTKRTNNNDSIMTTVSIMPARQKDWNGGRHDTIRYEDYAGLVRQDSTKEAHSVQIVIRTAYLYYPVVLAGICSSYGSNCDYFRNFEECLKKAKLFLPSNF